MPKYTSTTCWHSSTEFLLYLSKISWAYLCGSISGVYPVSFTPVFMPLPRSPYGITVAIIVHLKMNRVITPTLFFFVKIVIPIRGPGRFHVSFRISLCVQKNLAGILTGNTSNLYINLRKTDVFIMLSLSRHEYFVSLCWLRSF